MHDQIRRGAFRVIDGHFPPEADALFAKYGPAASLFQPSGLSTTMPVLRAAQLATTASPEEDARLLPGCF